MVSRDLEITINHALNEAKQRGHEFVTLEHVLYALLHNSRAEKAIKACGGSCYEIKKSLLVFFEERFVSINADYHDYMPKPTVAFQRVLQRAARHVITSGKNMIEAEAVLISMFAEKDSFALYFMEKQGVSRFDLMRWIAHGVPKEGLPPDLLASIGYDDDDLEDDEDYDPTSDATEQDEDYGEDHGLDENSWSFESQESLFVNTNKNKDEASKQEAADQSKTNNDSDQQKKPHENHKLAQEAMRAYRALKQDNNAQEKRSTKSTRLLNRFATNLCRKARKGLIDPIIGRENELERIIQILCRRQKNNPLLVGDAGVGKTAIAEGLAYQIVHNKVPEALKQSQIFTLDLGLVVAGSKYRGDFEERLRGITKELKRNKHIILFIDEIHTLIGAGSVGGGTLDASNLLKPALGSGDIRCIGATTFKEYRQHFESDHAMNRRFQKIDIEEPSPKEAYKILCGLKDRFESFHNIKYSQTSLQAAVQLSHKYMPQKRLPDKAIDVIDEVGASFSLKKPYRSNSPRLAGIVDVKRVVAQLASIPEENLRASDYENLKNLKHRLSSRVFGQDHAVAAVETTVKLARTGLGDDNRPQGVFFFAGPTGVGKTELSLQLAHILSVPLHRFDMSEYMERHAVSRLVGAPPGYVGYDNGGLLTEKVKQRPHCVILFDEIEKAHPDVHNILLQIMDRGVLTDSNGREADFRGTIIIMTSNVGAEEMAQWKIGFDQSTERRHHNALKALQKSFSPEFLGRIDHIITFRSLDLNVAEQIVKAHLVERAKKLKEKGFNLSYEPSIIAILAAKGFNPIYGARPLKGYIQENIRKPISQTILDHQPRAKTTIHVTENVDNPKQNPFMITLKYDRQQKASQERGKVRSKETVS
ncbi:MAG: AAA family ATPase [Proteobacteria bacterium]|nr:AAA family ATPase [Pseudomonadota bacterium]